jgi:hypothetical protein
VPAPAADLLDVASTLSYWLPLGAMKTTGMPLVMSAMGPCFISAAGMPSAWM